MGQAARDGTDRQGRCSTRSSTADRPRRRAVVPAGPIVGISCLANVAPIWNDTIATEALMTAAVTVVPS